MEAGAATPRATAAAGAAGGATEAGPVAEGVAAVGGADNAVGFTIVAFGAPPPPLPPSPPEEVYDTESPRREDGEGEEEDDDPGDAALRHAGFAICDFCIDPEAGAPPGSDPAARFHCCGR